MQYAICSHIGCSAVLLVHAGCYFKGWKKIKIKLKPPPTLFKKISDVKLEIFFTQPYGDDGDTRTTKFVKAFVSHPIFFNDPSKFMY